MYRCEDFIDLMKLSAERSFQVFVKILISASKSLKDNKTVVVYLSFPALRRCGSE